VYEDWEIDEVEAEKAREGMPSKAASVAAPLVKLPTSAFQLFGSGERYSHSPRNKYRGAKIVC
jgi:hypothetical protein